jgi:GH25 family lysozyme M1 (1,4-beta-N-acetylmuramidase)
VSDAQWANVIHIQYFFEEVQLLRFVVIDVDVSNKDQAIDLDKMKHDVIGSVVRFDVFQSLNS